MNKSSLLDHPFFHCMGVLGDVIVLGILFLVCSAPVITLGVSAAALFHVTGKMAAGEDYDVLHDFFRAVRQNWKQASLFWLPMLVLAVILIWDLHYGSTTGGVFGGVVTAAAAVLGFTAISVTGWGLALLSRYEYQQLREIVRDAFGLATVNLLADVVLIVLTLWVPALVLLSPELLSHLLPLAMVFGPGGGAWLASRAMRHAFNRIESRKEEPS